MKVWLILFFLSVSIVSAESAASPPAPKMRPYAGIGILQLPIDASDSGEPIPLYEEPALSRLGELNRAKIPPFDWIFSESNEFLPLIVMARKGAWLRVSYDDAGREAWLNPPRRIVFQSWELFFKGRISRLLPGLQKKYYQLFQQPDGTALAVLTNNQPFKVLSFENDWAMVLIDQDTLGWLRWRDEDGRLLLGVVGRRP